LFLERAEADSQPRFRPVSGRPANLPLASSRRKRLEPPPRLARPNVELAEVLNRRKLDRYITARDRQRFLRELSRIAEFVPVIQLIRECRDPKNDKFLEVVLNGRGDTIITGEDDLLALHPWRGIEIVSPADYLRLS
jgi:hypothetical protein